MNRAIGAVRTLLLSRRLLAAAWILIVIQCAAAIWLFRPWAIGDSFHYLALAQGLSHGSYGTVTQAGFEPDVLRPPGYPLILALLICVLHLPHVAVVILQLVAYCGAIYLLQHYLRCAGGNPVPFIVVAAAYPFAMLYSTYLLTEAWVIVATTVAALLALRRTPFEQLLAGAAAGIAAMIRADLLLLPLVFAGLTIFAEWRSGWPAAIGRASLPVIAAALVCIPYATWNAEKFGTFSPVPLGSAVGTSLYLSTWQRKFTDDDVKNLEQRRFTPHVRQMGLLRESAEIDRSIGAPENIQTFDPYDYPTVELRRAAADAYIPFAIKRIREDPGFYANHILHNVWELWVTKKYPDRIPRPVALLMRISSWAVFLLGFLGMGAALIRPRGWMLPWQLVPITLYPAAIHLWLHTEARYTAATRPLLMMFAAGFLWWALGRLCRASEASSGEPPNAAQPG